MEAREDMVRTRTVRSLIEHGWVGEKPYFDAAVCCPECSSVVDKGVIRRDGVDAESVHSSIREWRDGEFHCGSCDTHLFQESAVVYDYRVAKEQIEEPWNPLTAHSLVLDGDVDQFGAAAAATYYHNCSGDAELGLFPERVSLNLRPRCLLCRHDFRELDFHHWDYENDIGTSLCRSCHSYIHNEKTASQQSTHSWTDTWVDPALARLVGRYRSHTNQLTPGLMRTEVIKHLFNIPVSTSRIDRAVEKWSERNCDHTYVAPPYCQGCGMRVIPDNVV